MGVQTVERVGCTRQRRDKAEVVRIVQVALALADSRRQLRRLLSHIDAGVKALRRLLPLGCDGVNLRCTLAVVDEQVDFNTGTLGRFAVLTSLYDHALLILPQTGVRVHKSENRLPSRLLEQLQAQRCAELALRLLAEPLDELNVMVCQGFVEHPRPVLLRVAQLVEQDGAQRSDLAAGGDFAGQHQTGVLLQPVFTLRCRCFLCFALHALDKTFSRLSGVCFGCRTAHLLRFRLLLRSDGRTRSSAIRMRRRILAHILDMGGRNGNTVRHSAKTKRADSTISGSLSALGSKASGSRCYFSFWVFKLDTVSRIFRCGHSVTCDACVQALSQNPWLLIIGQVSGQIVRFPISRYASLRRSCAATQSGHSFPRWTPAAGRTAS